jgi:hypothetical protein
MNNEEEDYARFNAIEQACGYLLNNRASSNTKIILEKYIHHLYKSFDNLQNMSDD